MPIAAGEKLGPYQILAPIGAGGMGEVYRARDPRMGRDVAIKICPERFSGQLEHEVRTAATLNHPNICAVYDVGPNYLVMELVEGPTLADRLQQGPVPLDEAVPIARQIASALEAAHEKGVVHRDLKPHNIKLRPDGAVKVLDFGLATRENPVSANNSRPWDSPTLTMGATQVGMILGTAPYMSPEQARGRAVDRRTDIWAFGVVLYEMLTGKELFGGETVTDVLAAVVRNEPDWEKIPASIRPLLRLCLEKDPKLRLRDAGDAMLLLDAASEDVSGSVPPATRKWFWIGWIVAALCLLAFGAVSFLHFRESAPRAEEVRFEVPLPPKVSFTQTGVFAISPDGRKIAFSAYGADGIARLWMRNLDALTVQPLSGSETAANVTPFWSADSRFLGFEAEGKLKKVDVSGGSVQTICDVPRGVAGASWNRDDVIIFGSSQGIMSVSAAGGTPTPVTAVVPGETGGHVLPAFLPDGRYFLYLRGSAPGARAIYLGSVDLKPQQQETKPLLKTDHGVAYAPAANGQSGHILFVREGTLLAQVFNPRRFELSGEPVPVIEQVAATNFTFGNFSVSQNGSLIYRPATAGNLQLTWFNREGQVIGMPAEPARYGTVKISPAGTKAATVRTDQQTNNPAIWEIDLVQGTSTRFTFDTGSDTQPVWSADGTRIAWQSNRGGSWGFYQKSANGSGSDELLYRFTEEAPPNLTDWSHDGRFLIYAQAGDLWALPIGGKPIRLIETPATEYGAYLSPDSRWIAYIFDESGQREIYVQRFNLSSRSVPAEASPVSGKWMVSRGTLGLARWRSDGKELLYMSADGGIMAVDVMANSVFQASAPRLLFKLPPVFMGLSLTPGSLADVTRDNQRFLLTMPAEERQDLTAVLNWEAGLKR